MIRLKEVREARGLTQTQLAELSGIRQPHIARAESGEYSPSLKTLKALAKGLNVRVATLLLEHCPRCGEAAYLRYTGEWELAKFGVEFEATTSGTVLWSADRAAGVVVCGVLTERLSQLHIEATDNDGGLSDEGAEAGDELGAALFRLLGQAGYTAVASHDWCAVRCTCGWTY